MFNYFKYKGLNRKTPIFHILNHHEISSIDDDNDDDAG